MSLDCAPLNHEDRVALEQMLEEADRLAISKLGLRLPGEAADRFVIQELLDQDMLDWDDPSEIKPIELAVGRLLILMESRTKNPMPLEWCVVEDEWGRDFAIKHRDYEAIVSPIDLLAKRLEDGDTINLVQLLADVVSRVEELIEQGEVRRSATAAQ